MGIEELIIAMAEDRGAKKERDKAIAEKKEAAQLLKKNGVELSIIAESTKLPLSLIKSL